MHNNVKTLTCLLASALLALLVGMPTKEANAGAAFGNVVAAAHNADNDYYYLFSENYFAKRKAGGSFSTSTPLTHWPGYRALGWRGGPDAVVYNDDNNTWYFFKGREYARMPSGKRLSKAKKIDRFAPGFPGGWSRLDSAVYNSANNTYYLFSNGYYVAKKSGQGVANSPRKYNSSKSGFKSSEVARGSAGQDAAVFRRQAKSYYFFKNGRYSKKVSGSGFSKGYPRSIGASNSGFRSGWSPGPNARANSYPTYFAAVKDRDLGECPSGTFMDPRWDSHGNPECWKCPRGYSRTGEGIGSSRACRKGPARKNYQASYKSNTGSLLKSCPSGQFANFGSTKCYSCGSKKHDWAKKVGENGVCYTQSSASFRKASYVRRMNVSCLGGTFYDPRHGGECWSCESEYIRTAEAVTSSKACVHEDKALSEAFDSISEALNRCDEIGKVIPKGVVPKLSMSLADIGMSSSHVNARLKADVADCADEFISEFSCDVVANLKFVVDQGASFNEVVSQTDYDRAYKGQSCRMIDDPLLRSACAVVVAVLPDPKACLEGTGEAVDGMMASLPKNQSISITYDLSQTCGAAGVTASQLAFKGVMTSLGAKAKKIKSEKRRKIVQGILRSISSSNRAVNEAKAKTAELDAALVACGI